MITLSLCSIPLFYQSLVQSKILRVRLSWGGGGKNFATTALLNCPLVFQKLQFVLGQHPMINQTLEQNVFRANSVHKEYKNILRKEGTEKTTLENWNSLRGCPKNIKQKNSTALSRALHCSIIQLYAEQRFQSAKIWSPSKLRAINKLD